MKISLPRWLLLLSLMLGLTGPANAMTPPAAGPTTSRPLAQALNLDGTLKPGALGSFDARGFRMQTAPDGRPVFRPAGNTGAGDERWQSGFGQPGNGLAGRADAVAIRGNGDVYVGGFITQAGTLTVNGIAKWNGSAWSSLGMGATNGVMGASLMGSVSAIAIAGNGDVYVGGQFAQAGGIVANNVAKWNGTVWSNLGAGTGGTDSSVRALAIAPNGDVYAGGYFTQAGGIPASKVARWNGTSWNNLSSGMDASVSALAVASNGDLYAGGAFNQAGGIVANKIAKWNGTAWSSLGSGMDASVTVLVIAGNGEVYAAGNFFQAGGITANYVAKWNGSAWSSLGTGIPNGLNKTVDAMAISATGEVYIGTYGYSQSNAVVAKWNGTVWTALGTGIDGSVSDMAFGQNGKLYVGGAFSGTGDGSRAMASSGIYDPNAPLATTAAKTAPAAQFFPNPAHGTATLRLPAGASRQPLTLQDAQGRTVRRYAAPAGPDAVLDLRGLPAGVYVVRCGGAAQRLVVE